MSQWHQASNAVKGHLVNFPASDAFSSLVGFYVRGGKLAKEDKNNVNKKATNLPGPLRRLGCYICLVFSRSVDVHSLPLEVRIIDVFQSLAGLINVSVERLICIGFHSELIDAICVLFSRLLMYVV